MFTVYQHINKINGKRYIGITKRKPQERWGRNGNKYFTSPHFYNAINKYGWDNFEHIILYENLTKEEACKMEQELIKKYKTNDRKYGYNQTSGGEIFVMTEEVRLKMSNAMKGNKNGLGHPCSPEKAKKIGDAQRGMVFSEERRRKMSEKAKQRHVPCSEEKRITLQNNYPHMKKVYCLETDTVYKSVQECARQLNIQATSVTRACKKKIKSTHGYHLEYFNDTINA